jgi:hypothetical protein
MYIGAAGAGAGCVGVTVTGFRVVLRLETDVISALEFRIKGDVFDDWAGMISDFSVVDLSCRSGNKPPCTWGMTAIVRPAVVSPVAIQRAIRSIA